MSKRILSPEEIYRARVLKNEFRYSKRRLAQEFECGATTIWENIFATKPRVREDRREYFKRYINGERYSYRTLHVVRVAVGLLKEKEYNSLQVAQILQVPLEDVNYVYTRVWKE